MLFHFTKMLVYGTNLCVNERKQNIVSFQNKTDLFTPNSLVNIGLRTLIIHFT